MLLNGSPEGMAVPDFAGVTVKRLRLPWGPQEFTLISKQSRMPCPEAESLRSTYVKALDADTRAVIPASGPGKVSIK